MSFQSRFYALRTQDSSHFSAMLYRASDLHRDRFEVTHAKALRSPYVFTSSWTMCVYRCLSYALISTAMNCKHWQTLAL